MNETKIRMRRTVIKASLFFSLCLSGLSMRMWAQTPAERVVTEAAEKTRMVSEIVRASTAMQSLQCDFKQTKRLSLLAEDLVAHGKMYYRGDGLLRWEYTAPYTYVFILNREQVIMKSETRTDVVDVASNRLFKEIASVMMHSVTGACLTDEKDFAIRLSVEGTYWVAGLTPRKREMRQMFSEIRLYYDTRRSVVERIVLVEPNGDETRIVLSGIEKDGVLDEALFR